MKKILVNLLLTASLFADCGGKCFSDCNQDCGCEPCMKRCDIRCNACCCEPCACEPCDFCPPPPPENCAYNAPSIFDLRCSWNMFISGTFLYMQAKEENLKYLETLQSSQSGPVTDLQVTNNVKLSKLSYDYLPALKFAAGITFGCDNWNAKLEYFRYHGTPGKGSFSQKIDLGADDLAVCFYFDRENVSPVSCQSVTANTDWQLEIDMADLLLRRKYYVGRCLIFQPAAGLAFGFIDQVQTTDYACIQENPSGNINTANHIRNYSDSWCIGFKTGLDLDWIYHKCFRLFASTTFSMLYTNYHDISSTQTKTIEQNAEKTTITTKLSSSLSFLRPDASIALGLGWGDYWYCNDWYFDVTVGYEFHTYWNQNVLPQLNNCSQDPSSLFGDLYLQGLTVRGRLDF